MPRLSHYFLPRLLFAKKQILYDRKKYAAMLHEAFEPFVLCVPNRAEPAILSDSVSEDDLKRFPLFSALAMSRL